MTRRPYSSLTRRDAALDAAAMADRAAELAPMLDEAEAKSEPPSRPAMTLPLCLLATGHPFTWAGESYRAAEAEREVNGVRCRRVLRADKSEGWLPVTSEIQPSLES